MRHAETENPFHGSEIPDSIIRTQVLIVGGGITGSGLARDLALRGLHCVVLEKNDMNAGASGANHGLLHSGARYLASDPMAAIECRKEGELLKKLAGHCIEDTGGLFVAVEGDDESYISDFPERCRTSGIRVQHRDVREALEMEPALSSKVIAAFEVPDATIDPFKLTLDNMAHARKLGAIFFRFTELVSFKMDQNLIAAVSCIHHPTGKTFQIEAEMVVNATGAWAGMITALADLDFPMSLSKGSLLITQSRLSTRVINRLRKATDGDILVPGGTVSILGTSSVRIESPDVIYPEIEEIDGLIDEGSAMVPSLKHTRYIRAYCGVRPLTGCTEDRGTQDDRCISRGFELMDHAGDGIDNFITITGGKLTTYRLMAEKTGDLVCRKAGISAPCRTRLEPLPPAHEGKWTEPGLSARSWVRKKNPDDLILCECEMVPQSTVKNIHDNVQKYDHPPNLKNIGLRSRIGKGPCQGSFCSQRVTAYLYDQEKIDSDEGLIHLCEFLHERWRGQRPLAWDMTLIQFELQEALYCGLFNLEMTCFL